MSEPVVNRYEAWDKAVDERKAQADAVVTDREINASEIVELLAKHEIVRIDGCDVIMDVDLDGELRLFLDHCTFVFDDDTRT